MLIMIITTNTMMTSSCDAFLLSHVSKNSHKDKYVRQLPYKNKNHNHHRILDDKFKSVADDCQGVIEDDERSDNKVMNRRRLLSTASTMLIVATATLSPNPAIALVKGVAPPPKKSAGEKIKCTNVEECQAMAEKREELRAQQEETGEKPNVTKKGGVRYRDLPSADNTSNEKTVAGDDDEATSASTSSSVITAQEGDNVRVYFKVLKLGKRSYDGLSGEGTVVFSEGFGLEDDEDKPGQKYFSTTIGNPSNIEALNEALIGMKTNGIRRFAIYPQQGWEKASRACDGGPGGRGDGGTVRTDYVVVPTATMVQQEDCFDNTKLPFPNTYAQQRRMAQRFDQSLIMEVQMVSIEKQKSSTNE